MKPFVEVTVADLRALADLLEAGEVYVIRYNAMMAVLRPEARGLTPEVCMCGHEQFHHDRRKCWVDRCTCRGFRPDPRANERTQQPTPQPKREAGD
jgi:hypothetical protein